VTVAAPLVERVWAALNGRVTPLDGRRVEVQEVETASIQGGSLARVTGVHARTKLRHLYALLIKRVGAALTKGV